MRKTIESCETDLLRITRPHAIRILDVLSESEMYRLDNRFAIWSKGESNAALIKAAKDKYGDHELSWNLLSMLNYLLWNAKWDFVSIWTMDLGQPIIGEESDE